ncbi:hypothetical protein HYW19_00135 [Candidatus Woesearchaeota archaeon]|nr:hypothetical protein [Candidatus Woesearchaeota archaeon]
MTDSKDNGQKQTSLDARVGGLITRDYVTGLLSSQDRWLNEEELRATYNSVFLRMASPGQWDVRLQKGQHMPQEAIAAELGQRYARHI